MKTKLYRIERISESWERRVVAGGFVQHREIYQDSSRGPWQFYVSCFDSTPAGQSGTCEVATIYGLTTVPIDPDNRIMVNRRWHSRQYWDH